MDNNPWAYAPMPRSYEDDAAMSPNQALIEKLAKSQKLQLSEMRAHLKKIGVWDQTLSYCVPFLIQGERVLVDLVAITALLADEEKQG